MFQVHRLTGAWDEHIDNSKTEDSDSVTQTTHRHISRSRRKENVPNTCVASKKYGSKHSFRPRRKDREQKTCVASRDGKDRRESCKTLTVRQPGEPTGRKTRVFKKRDRRVLFDGLLNYYDEAMPHVSIFREVLDEKRLEFPCKG